MTHSFEKEDELSLRKYINKKIYLYNEAREINEDAQVRRIHTGLNSDLQAAIPLKSTSNTLEDFKDIVSRNEYNVRQKWQKAHDKRDAQQRQIHKLQNQLDLVKKTNSNRIDKPAQFNQYQRYDDGNKNYPNSFQPPHGPYHGFNSQDRKRGTKPSKPRTPTDNAPDSKDKGASAPRDKQNSEKFDGQNRFQRKQYPRTGGGDKGVKVFVTVINKPKEDISPETLEDIQRCHQVDEESAESNGAPLSEEEGAVKPKN